MAPFDHSGATLRLFGDDLDPDTIGALLGASPTRFWRKDQELVGSATGVVRVARTGSWQLGATRREPEDLEGQVLDILEKLTQDLSVWESLARYQPDLLCGLFMGRSNNGLSLCATTLLKLGQRGIALELDIYDAGAQGPEVGR
ncbi:MAG: hypothetical protein AMXMBFR59_33830 [Rhodanobacteraceae bacterium]